jgi:recombination protein RecT
METDANTKLSGKLEGQGAGVRPSSFKETLVKWWNANGGDIKRLIGGEEDAKRLFSTAIFVINKNPTLLECDPLSFFQCMMQSAALKLFPGPMNECAWVPFRNSQRGGIKEATFMTMYPGIVKLIYNAGFVKRIDAKVVYEADQFEYEDGLNPVLKFKPFMGPEKDRGNRLLVYCLAVTRFGEIQVACLSPWMVEQHRTRSKAAKSSDSPWNSSYSEDVDWMWKKTAVLQCGKLLPKSAELAEILDLEVNDKPKEIISVGDILGATKRAAKDSLEAPPVQPALPEGTTGVEMDAAQGTKKKESVVIESNSSAR